MNDGNEQLMIMQAFRTWWLSLEIAVSSIVDQWVELKTHFEMARHTENCYMSEGLHGTHENHINLRYLFFETDYVWFKNIDKVFKAKWVTRRKLRKDFNTFLCGLVKTSEFQPNRWTFWRLDFRTTSSLRHIKATCLRPTLTTWRGKRTTRSLSQMKLWFKKAS